ncbi:sulfolactate dehydrogenase [Alphaproteobacteria bacterium]|nr:sulfolactate dehydrogenase [Alphaproteobacteria bacterium]
MKISISELRKQIMEVLSKKLTSQDSETIADYLIYAEMAGNKTQGIIKMTGTEPIQEIIAEYPVKIERETKVSAVLDGGKNPAIVVAKMAVDIATQKAKGNGIAIVGARNTFSSNGAQSYYVEQIAKQDLIGVMMSRSPGSVAPFGSIDPLFGTNPIGYGFPTETDPIVFDGATSAMTFYGLVVAKAHGEKLPEGVATDKDGNPTTDPSAVIDGGAIVPFGNSHKAAGFGMFVELMAGPLIGGAYLDHKTFDKEWGSTIIAIDPSIFVDLDVFKKNCSDFVEVIRKSRTRPNEQIYFPNDKSRRNYALAEKSGMVDVDEVIYNQIFQKGKGLE